MSTVQPFENQTDKEEAERIQRLLASSQPATTTTSRDFNLSQVAAVVQQVGPYTDAILNFLAIIIPVVQKIWAVVSKVSSMIPEHIGEAIYGVGLCFFGGSFAASIAAVEAFKLCGWNRTKVYLADLATDFNALKSAHDADNRRDDDNDGVADVLQMDTKDRVRRKLMVYFNTIDPNRVIAALGGVYQGLVGVISTLQFKFAKTVTLGISIGNILRKPAALYLAPVLARHVATSHQKWIPLIISYACKTIAVSIAWWIQFYLSTVQSAMTGGVHCSRALMKFAVKKGYSKVNEESTMLDEYAGWALAAIGIYFQLWLGYSLMFPFSLILWPLMIVEWILRWFVG